MKTKARPFLDWDVGSDDGDHPEVLGAEVVGYDANRRKSSFLKVAFHLGRDKKRKTCLGKLNEDSQRVFMIVWQMNVIPCEGYRSVDLKSFGFLSPTNFMIRTEIQACLDRETAAAKVLEKG